MVNGQPGQSGLNVRGAVEEVLSQEKENVLDHCKLHNCTL